MKKIIKLREFRDIEDRKIYQGFYLNQNDLVYIKENTEIKNFCPFNSNEIEREVGEFYILSPYSELETKIVFPSVAQGLRRLENIDEYIQKLTTEINAREYKLKWMDEVLK